MAEFELPGNAVKLFGAELKGATNSVVGLAGNLLSGSMKLSDYSKALDTNTKILGKLGKVVNALTMFAEESLSEYQSLTGIGASFGKEMTNIKIAAAELGMTVEEMTTLFKDNAEGLSAFGGSTDQAISAFRNFSSSVLSSPVGTNLRRLGYTVNEINENLLTYSEIAEQDNQLERSVGRDRNASALEFAKELDALSKLTGKQREDLANQMKEARRQGDVQAFLTGQSAEASEALSKGLTEISSTMGPQYAELFKDLLIRGAPTTDQTRAAFVALGDSADEFQAQVDAFKSGMASSDFSAFDNEMANTQAAFTRYLNTEEARSIGMLGGLTEVSQAQGQLREDSYTFANRLNMAGAAAEDTLVKLQRITAEIEKQQAIQMQDAGDDANLIDETIKLNEATRDMVLATQKSALENLEDMGVKALQKVQDALPSAGEISTQMGQAVNRLFEAAEKSAEVYQNMANGGMTFEEATVNADNVELNDIQDTDVATASAQQELREDIAKAESETYKAQEAVKDAEKTLSDLQKTAARMTQDGFTRMDPQLSGIKADIERAKADLLRAQDIAMKKYQMEQYKKSGRFIGGLAEGGMIRRGEYAVTGEMGPELISGPGNVLSTENTRNLVTALRNSVDNGSTSSYNNESSTISNNITETMVSMLEGRLDKQNSLLENLLRVETSASETGRKQFKATKGLSGNMLKGIGS